jgi:hypothetical protein
MIRCGLCLVGWIESLQWLTQRAAYILHTPMSPTWHICPSLFCLTLSQYKYSVVERVQCTPDIALAQIRYARYSLHLESHWLQHILQQTRGTLLLHEAMSALCHTHMHQLPVVSYLPSITDYRQLLFGIFDNSIGSDFHACIKRKYDRQNEPARCILRSRSTLTPLTWVRLRMMRGNAY